MSLHNHLFEYHRYLIFEKLIFFGVAKLGKKYIETEKERKNHKQTNNQENKRTRICRV